MKRSLLIAAALLATAMGPVMAGADAVPVTDATTDDSPAAELILAREFSVTGMAAGNLSGVARCDGVWWGVSDREDDRLYRLDEDGDEWRAVAETFSAPPPPDSGLPTALTLAAKARTMFGAGQLDLEGISCDGEGNRYLVSESHAAVLVLASDGTSHWLDLPGDLVTAAREAGLLQRVNALYEGIAVDTEGARLWLAAERQGRGLLRVDLDGQDACAAGCILVAEDRQILPPPALGSEPLAADFSALTLHGGKLFSLERLAHRLCRRDPDGGAVERCWSYADTALAAPRRYDSPYGLAEALWLDDEGAWIGVDNNDQVRADGEARPTVWHFIAPPGGWGD